MKTIYFPEHITSLACSDFDETYFAHQHSHPEDVKALESFIAQYAHKGLLFGIVSASTKEMIESCLKHGPNEIYPHFISTNSGTEIFYFDDEQWRRDEDYHKKFVNNYDKSIILNIERVLKSKNIDLITQTPFINAPFTRNYYYKMIDKETDEKNFDIILKLAEQHHFCVNISMCNPLIGDPENHYDIDFYPQIAGKHAIVRYLMDKFGIPQSETFAFGDSGNDIKMLRAVNYGYLVNNATPDAKKLYPNITENTYNKGITEVLTAHFKG